jgi:predicted RNA binding protein YcfA (HicA-like mRNA interferase family)
MKLPRDLSGDNLARLLCRDWNYILVHQVGSHVILQTDEPSPHRIAVPAHKALKIGTLNGILRAVATHKNVSREDILAAL